MSIRTITVTAAICCLMTITGCASRQAATIGSGTQSSALTTTATTPLAASTEKADDTLTTGSVTEEKISPAGEATEEANNPRKEIYLDPVYFDFDSYILRADARDALTRNFRWLSENKLTRVIIEGHADERGSDEYNLALAEKRAIAAKRYIETLGVNPDRLQTISYGENKPAMAGHYETSWAKNRRVEFVIAE